ncbi:MAG: hypothetical protein QF578_07255 [Alphaproteobacteria bacterium]|jgi:7,8-dihydropterin-6-yl-methyl-4-(beta-D-ribofuranosyl)aminobenzene 5'-phosphate synthase|nr:hypothetical protein [Alphaproteobacteria bacterium]MDP6564609.1 hypothetical protein [Alphaproteobacteria bacterium]MDP6816339.1 hypothetical protein [Alphaproteobacteria bacterium]
MTVAAESLRPVDGLEVRVRVEPIIPDTVAQPANFDLDVIVPAHCTGFRAVTALVNAFGDRVVPSAVGRLYRF